jgi:DNA-binding transcriptional LysR family regulator
VVEVSAPLLFSQIAMGELAAGYALKYPEVRLEVTTEDRPVDMIEEGYDLAIRVNPHPDGLELRERAPQGRTKSPSPSGRPSRTQ